MADEQETRSGSRGGAGNGGGKDAGSSVLLVGTTAAILLAGWAWRSEPMRERVVPAQPLPAPVPIDAPAERTAAELPLEPPPPSVEPVAPSVPAITPHSSPPPAAVDSRLTALAHRAENDLARITRAPGTWTAQLAVACKTDTVSRLVGSAKGSAKLYVLPAELKGSACFRICWGSYASAKDASAAKDLPAALRGKEPVRAVEIAKVVP